VFTRTILVKSGWTALVDRLNRLFWPRRPALLQQCLTRSFFWSRSTFLTGRRSVSCLFVALHLSLWPVI
jgi:hypothetical protein